MSKFVGVVVGGLEIAAGLYLEFVTFGASTPLTMFLISSGAGMVLSGIGTMLTGTVGGTTTASRNPIAPWNVIYGRAKLGGTLLFVDSFGDNDKYLDLIFVLACHQCEDVFALLFNGQRIRLDGNGCSFTPTQQTINITNIARVKNVVTVDLASSINDLQSGDSLIIKNVSDHSFNGTFAITVVDANTFTYISGGLENTVAGSGQAETMWPDYKAKVHMEVVLGDHTETFPGLLTGTPYDGDPGDLVVNPNPIWTNQHLLLGRTAAFVRLHYNDEVFANGLPTISFHVKGKNDIYDPRLGSDTLINILQRPTVFLNGWGHNQHEGPYELGEDQGTNWGLNDDVTYSYQNAGNATNKNQKDAAFVTFRHTHKYAGCIYKFAAIGDTSPATQLFLNVYSEVESFGGEGRSAGIWYSLNNGVTWTELYNTNTHPLGWNTIPLSLTIDASQLQVMAFTDSHDNMAHFVYDLQISDVPGADQVAVSHYTENAVLCTADYLANTAFGFKAIYGTEIPLDRLISGANICDEPITTASGAIEPRYALNGTFPLTMKRGEVLQNLLTACAGRLTYSQGKYVIWPAAWLGVSLDDGNSGEGGVSPGYPVPPASNQRVAWAYATVTASQDAGAGIGTASITTKGGALTQSFSTPFSGIGKLNWSNFQVPTTTPLPDDAVIEAIYPVAVAEANLAGGGPGGHGGSCPGALASGFVGPTLGVNFDEDVTTSAQYNGPSVGNTHINLEGVSIGFTMGATMGNYVVGPGLTSLGCEPVDGSIFSYKINSSLTVGFVGAAIYYTSASQGSPIVPGGGGGGAGNNPTPIDSAIAAGPFRWVEKVSARDLYNGVKGSYISPTNNWQASDFPPYAQDSMHGYMSGAPLYFPFGDKNLAEDGGDRRWLDIQLPFTISVAAAQRVAKIELLRRRQQGTGTFLYNMAMYNATSLDVCRMTLPLLGWVNKLLEIQQHRFTMSNASDNVIVLGTEIDVQETDPSVYTWSSSEELSANGYQYSTAPGGEITGGTLAAYRTYTIEPVIALSQPDATHIQINALTATFPLANRSISYNLRSITIPDPGGTPTWYYVVIQDAEYSGDLGGVTTLQAVAQTSTVLVGIDGNVYVGAILCTHAAGATATSLSGGWPVPQGFIIGS